MLLNFPSAIYKLNSRDFNLVNGEWSCKSMPSIFIDESRAKQMKNKEILKTNIQTGKELIESVTNPEVKKE